MRYIDLGVILAYLIGITWFGARFGKGQSTLKDYFLGGREAPWWAIGFSIVSAETSTLTVIGTPGLSFAGNFGFLQVVLGYLFARILISVVFLPTYFRGEMFTAYELMQRRFGPNIRKLTAGLFLGLTRAAAAVLKREIRTPRLPASSVWIAAVGCAIAWVLYGVAFHFMQIALLGPRPRGSARPGTRA